MKVMHKLLVSLFALGVSVVAPAGLALADDDDGDEGAVAVANDPNAIADDDPSAVVIFRDRLAPYGTWSVHPTYGTIWVPSSHLVGGEFSPYVTAGHWELTADGDWLWASDYEWGYVPFHYGRWVWIEDVGWSWIPGRQYAPSWVVWRTGEDGYIGWAPAPPEYYWVDGFALAYWTNPIVAYAFCPTTHVFHHDVHTYVIHDRDGVATAAKKTRPYHPAKPTKSAPNHGTPRSGHGPSVDEAHIAKGDLPKSVGVHNIKAMEFMKPESIAKSKALAKTRTASVTKSAGINSAASTAKRPRAAGVAGFTMPARDVKENDSRERNQRPDTEGRDAPRTVDRAERSERAQSTSTNGSSSTKSTSSRSRSNDAGRRSVERDDDRRSRTGNPFDSSSRSSSHASRASRTASDHASPRTTPRESHAPMSPPSSPSSSSASRSNSPTQVPSHSTKSSGGKSHSKH